MSEQPPVMSDAFRTFMSEAPAHARAWMGAVRPSVLGGALGLVTASKLILVNLCNALTILGLAVVAVFGIHRRTLGG